jgi:hypothetical protein
MVHIRMHLLAIHIPFLDGRSLLSRGDFVQMVQKVQESGASDLWSFQLSVHVGGRRESCEAIRVGWLDVPWQPMLRGEWKFYLQGVSSEDPDMPTAAPNASMDSQTG